jgi:hypothetical protein
MLPERVGRRIRPIRRFFFIPLGATPDSQSRAEHASMTRMRRSLSQYIVRAPLSLTMIEWNQDTVTWKAPQVEGDLGTHRV